MCLFTRVGIGKHCYRNYSSLICPLTSINVFLHFEAYLYTINNFTYKVYIKSCYKILFLIVIIIIIIIAFHCSPGVREDKAGAL